MNDNEKISVELEAKTSKFQQKIQEAISKMKELRDKATERFEIYPNAQKSQSLINNIKDRMNISAKPTQSSNVKSLVGDLLDAQKNVDKLDSSMGRLSQAFVKIKEGSKAFGEGLKSAFGSHINNMKLLGSKIIGIKDKFKQTAPACERFKNNLSKAFKSGINSIKRFGMSLLGIRTLFSLVSRAMNSYMSQDTELANKMSAVWIGLGSLLAPILERIANLLITIVKYVNTFVSSLTGVDLLAKGMDKAKKSTLGTASAVNKLQGGLSGLDEITNIAQNDSGGGTGGLNWTDAFDGTQMFDSLDGIENTIFEKINSGLEIALGWLRNTDFTKIGGDVGKKISDWITNINWGNVARVILRGITSVFDTIIGFVLGFDWGALGKAIKDFIVGWFEEAGDWLKEKDWTQIGYDLYYKIRDFIVNLDVGTIVKAIVKFLGKLAVSLLQLLGGFCAGIITDIYDSLSKYVEEHDWKDIMVDIIKGLFYWLTPVWILDLVWEYIVSPFIDGFKELFGIHSPSKVMEELGKDLIDGLFGGLKGLWDSISGIFTDLKEKISTKFEEIKTNIGEKVDGWISKIREKFSWDKIKDKFNTFKNNISNGLNTISEMKANVTTFFKGDTSDLKKKTSAVYEGVKSGIGSALGWTASKVAKLGGWLASLDTGTNYVPNDQLALIHKGEAVIPKRFNSEQYFNQGNDETNRLLEELIEAVNNKDSDVYLDGNKIGESTRKYISQQNRIMGRSVI